MLQYILVFIILAAALAYAIWKIYNAATHTDSLCSGCQGCPLKDKKGRCKSRKELLQRINEKKNAENLVE